MSQESSDWEASWNGQQVPQRPVEGDEVSPMANITEERHDGQERPPVTLRELMSALAASDPVPDSDIEHHEEVLHRSLEVGLGVSGDLGEDWKSHSDSLLVQQGEIEIRPLIAPEALEPSPAEKFAVSYNDPIINPSPSRSSWTHDDQSTPLRRSHDASSLIDQPNNGAVQLDAPEEPHALKRNPKYPPERLSLLLNMDLDADDMPSPASESPHFSRLQRFRH